MHFSDVNVNINFPLNQPNVCEDHSSILLLIIIHSSLSAYDRRVAIRETWGTKSNFAEHIPLLFFFSPGKEDALEIEDSLRREGGISNDIVQGDFLSEDIFATKLITSSVWIKRFCSQVSYVLMLEDTSIVDVFKLVPYLKSLSSSSWRPVFWCDLLQPHEKTHLSERDSSKAYCSAAAFLTHPVILGKLARTLCDNQKTLKGAWLSEIADSASVLLSNSSRFFTGIRRKPSMLKELMSPDYLQDNIMVALVMDTIEGREATMMRHAWRLIYEHHSRAESLNIYGGNEISPPSSTESGHVIAFAVGLMCVDFAIIAFIFLLIFCKRKRKVRL